MLFSRKLNHQIFFSDIWVEHASDHVFIYLIIDLTDPNDPDAGAVDFNEFKYVFFFQHLICYVVLYGCETWSLTLREECRLRVFENRILRRIFGPKRDENGEWRRFHNEELHSLYRSPNIVRVIKSRRLRWAGYVA